MRLSKVYSAFKKTKNKKFLNCSDCFHDEGLRLKAYSLGFDSNKKCCSCNSSNGRKLNKELLEILAKSFFVWGSLIKTEYGASPLIQFNSYQETDIALSSQLETDILIFESALDVGFFYYGPRLWMVGEIEPLKKLQCKATRPRIIQEIISKYETTEIGLEDKFYRIRIKPDSPNNHLQYDSPPIEYSGNGRLDTESLSILYGSQDLEICLHECRVSSEDDIFLATLYPTQNLKLLDLTQILIEDDTSEFESLDLTVQMLFLAGNHAYEILRALSEGIKNAGFDGLIYPSYFSMLRTGRMPFETIIGMSQRKIPELHQFEKSKVVGNLALFDYPIKDGKVKVKTINRIQLTNVNYGFQFGPVIDDI